MRDSVAIVTGASGGIGRHTALLLAGMGSTVVAASRSGELLKELEHEARGFGRRIVPRMVDLTRTGQAEGLVDETLREFGRIDVLVCNAGTYQRRRARETTVADYERHMALNFYGAVRMILRALPHMLERGRGHIIAVSSVDGKKGLPMDAAYVASKYALNGFMDVLRQELRGTGVWATTVCPARVDTQMIASLRVPMISAKIAPERVAGAIVRSLRSRRAEVIVPWLGPKLLIVLSAIWAEMGDFFVRLLNLEGEDTIP